MEHFAALSKRSSIPEDRLNDLRLILFKQLQVVANHASSVRSTLQHTKDWSEHQARTVTSMITQLYGAWQPYLLDNIEITQRGERLIAIVQVSYLNSFTHIDTRKLRDNLLAAA